MIYDWASDAEGDDFETVGIDDGARNLGDGGGGLHAENGGADETGFVD